MALGSAAVLFVYAAGYAETRSQRTALDDQLELLDAAAPTSLTATAIAISAATPVPFRPLGEFTPARATETVPSVTPSPVEATATPGERITYRDGTYVAKGSGGHGWVEVTLAVEGGAIVSVEISGCGTMYPCSKIKDLPERVIERQSAAVGWISGASDSSRGFRLAVLAALAKAKGS